MNFTSAILNPDGRLIILADVIAGVWCRAWILHSGICYKVTFSSNPTEVWWNNATSLTLGANVAAVIAGAGKWFWDGTYLYVSTPGGASVWANTIQAIVTLRFSNHPRVVGGFQYDPRLKSSPNLSQRIEAQFGGVGQIGGGQMTFNNADGFFDSKLDWQWDARQVKLSLGMDIPGATAADADFLQVGTWIVQEWSRNGLSNDFQLRLVEAKVRIKADLPGTTFTRAAFPNIDQANVGKPIPIAYGVNVGVDATGYMVDPGTKTFKIASHQIRSFDGVRIQTTKEVAFTETTTGFALYSANVYRAFHPNRTTKEVRNGATVLTTKTSISEVQATNNTWFESEGWIYVHVSSLGTVTSDYTVSQKIWSASSFVSTDLVNATFSLGNDYPLGNNVSVDFTGRLDGTGAAILNASDLVSDLLAFVGETNLDTTSFANAKTALKLGTDPSGNAVYKRNVGLFISDKRPLTDILSDVNAACGTYTYSNSLGQFFFGVFDPRSASVVFDISEPDILEYSDLITVTDIISSETVNYQRNAAEGYSQIETFNRSDLFRIHNQPFTVDETTDLIFSDQDDSKDYAQRTSFMKGKPLKRFTLTLWWKGWLYKLGDLIMVSFRRRGIYGKFEVLEFSVDLVSMKTKLVLGDLRGFWDSPGYWTSDTPTLPTAFASLTGYGSGAASPWNSSWDKQIKDFCRQNFGYWTDDNGFADPADPESHMGSTWV